MGLLRLGGGDDGTGEEMKMIELLFVDIGFFSNPTSPQGMRTRYIGGLEGGTPGYDLKYGSLKLISLTSF